MPLKRRNSPKLDGVDSVQLAQLPRLRYREELKSIALALQADPAKVLNLARTQRENRQVDRLVGNSRSSRLPLTDWVRANSTA